ncbi:inositol-pentakisphosphate 2-kinase [Malassezia yamatoensis]|uniref:Inositol-pentakisphosphate 2-kinase n=1 Tax=Malassezia yamatoensis TaxID=253288 RepID=A0AAJ6CGR3_9BASI|nr:inositol-pentakisphosphate 2-kinase [Malassezia yamatoensis]
MALRLRKTCKKPTSESAICIDDFVSEVLVNILSKDALPFYRRIYADTKVIQFLQEISAKCEGMRPQHRRESGSIDLEPTYIFATQDLTCNVSPISCFVAEIKPKCGFLYEGHTLDANKRLYSRYRMQSIYKAELAIGNQQSQAQNHTTDVSRAEFEARYDPIDLFSADYDRVQAAVTGLCGDFVFSRANNLHLWHAGKHLKWPMNLAILQEVIGVSEQDPCLIVRELANLLLPRLMHPQIRQELDTLVKAQARLDAIGIEGIATAWDRLTGSRLEHCTMGKLSELQTDLLAPASLEEYKRAAAYPPKAIENALDLRTAMIAHLLSATLKDVSFFVDVNSKTQLHWVDLDPKSVRKLPHYALLDAQISESFARWLKSHPPGS